MSSSISKIDNLKCRVIENIIRREHFEENELHYKEWMINWKLNLTLIVYEFIAYCILHNIIV